MQRNRTSLGPLLSIAAFAMLTLTQWLHSPLHHLAESLPEQAQSANAEEAACLNEETHSSYCCSHSHQQESHQHEQVVQQHAQHHSDDHNCPGHPHPDDECQICLYVSHDIAELDSAVSLIGVDTVELVSDSTPLFLFRIEEDHFLIRGPPVA